MKSIYHFLCYRLYLKEYYLYQKEHNRAFSYRSFATKMGVKGQNYLQWLIDGQRNLSLKMLPRLIEIIGLTEEESLYFTEMVHFAHAKGVEEKEAYFQKLIEIRKSFVATEMDEMEYELFSTWYIDAIRHTLNLIDFDPKEKNCFRRLSRIVRPKISEVEARRAVRVLERLGLVKLNSEGYLRLTKKILTTGNEVNSFYVKQFHRSMLDMAKESMDTFPSHQRDISALSLAVSDDCFADIKKEIQETRKRILERVARDSNPTNIYELNIQLFPLAVNDYEE